ncbi:helix-turn-helix domain-containing protein [bacterium]|nr:helix-turn-helix domain-containing protein [bacterium]
MNTQLLSIKAKKFGVRLAAFRQKKGLTTEVLSQWTGISNEKLQSMERGESNVTLPEIELIALKLGFSTETLIDGDLQNLVASKPEEGSLQQYAGLRDRMIALVLRKSRMEQDLAIETVASQCGLQVEELDQYESGRKPVPLPILELLCAAYQIPLLSLLTPKTVDEPASDQMGVRVEPDNDLPEDLAEFIHNPANLPYIELARKLSELDAAKLRGIAQGLLEITY